jgi:hypothetical protein
MKDGGVQQSECISLSVFAFATDRSEFFFNQILSDFSIKEQRKDNMPPDSDGLRTIGWVSFGQNSARQNSS